MCVWRRVLDYTSFTTIVVIAAPLFAAATTVMAFQGAGHATPLSDQTRAAALLRRARSALGGERLKRVTSLAAEATLSWSNTPDKGERLDFLLLWPDRFQRRTESVVHTLDGASYRQNRDNPPALLERAERNVRLEFVKTALIFLLRELPDRPLTMRLAADTVISGRAAHGLEFTGADNFACTIWVDAEHGAPVAYTQPWQVDGALVQRLTTLEDYRTVDGVRLPFRMRDTLAGKPNATIVFASIRVDPLLTSKDFRN